jgi:hypothetical protein
LIEKHFPQILENDESLKKRLSFLINFEKNQTINEKINTVITLLNDTDIDFNFFALFALFEKGITGPFFIKKLLKVYPKSSIHVAKHLVLYLRHYIRIKTRFCINTPVTELIEEFQNDPDLKEEVQKIINEESKSKRSDYKKIQNELEEIKEKIKTAPEKHRKILLSLIRMMVWTGGVCAWYTALGLEKRLRKSHKLINQFK